MKLGQVERDTKCKANYHFLTKFELTRKILFMMKWFHMPKLTLSQTSPGFHMSAV